MSVFFKKSGVVNVRMIITEEKILSNILKVKKLINPNAKRQIIKLEEDLYFKDLVESITSYLIDYPDKKNFPAEVYKEAFELVEFATHQFEENDRKSRELVLKREENKKISYLLQEALETVTEKRPGWIENVSRYEGKFSVEIAEALTVLANDSLSTEEDLKSAKSFVDAKIKNLSKNLFIEIDLERIEDSSKVLSFIGIEIADALKSIPTPVEHIVKDTNFEKNAEVIKKVLVSETAKLEIKPKEENCENFANEELEELEELEESPKAIEMTEVEQETNESNVENIDTIETEETSDLSEEMNNIDITESSFKDIMSNLEESESNVEKLENENVEEINISNEKNEELENFLNETRVEKKKSFFEKLANTKLIRAIRYIFGIRIVLDYPALPEGN